MAERNLTRLFQEYYFSGETNFPNGVSPHIISSMTYDSQSGLFLATSADHNGLSHIAGFIGAQTSNSSDMVWRQIYQNGHSIVYQGSLQKEMGSLFISGYGQDQQTGDIILSELKVEPICKNLTVPYIHSGIDLVLPVTR